MIHISLVAQRSRSTDLFKEKLKNAGYELITEFDDEQDFTGRIRKEPCDMILVLLDKNNQFILKVVEHIAQEKLNLPSIYCIKNKGNQIAQDINNYKPDNILFAPFTAKKLNNIIEISIKKTLNGISTSGKIKNGHTNKINKKTMTPQVELRKNEYAFFKSGIEIIKVFYNEIKYIHSDHVYVFLVTFNKKIPLRAKLEDIENYLPENTFHRIHQRYIINLDHITKVNTDVVFLDENELPLSKKYKKSLLSQMNVFS